MAASTKMLSSIQKRRLDIRFSSFLEKRMKRDRTHGGEQALRANRTAMKTGKKHHCRRKNSGWEAFSYLQQKSICTKSEIVMKIIDC
jgi:macrodomain Ter protein organizer (MatP/YcbG family)